MSKTVPHVVAMSSGAIDRRLRLASELLDLCRKLSRARRLEDVERQTARDHYEGKVPSPGPENLARPKSS